METLFYKPKSLSEAVALMGRQGNTVIVNGGSDIVLSISAGKISPAAIVYVADIEGLDEITGDDEYVAIGGSATYLQMQRSPICCRIAGLMQSIRGLGSPPIRAIATPAGNIATAAPSADCATMLLALGAELVLVSAQGERVVAQKDIYIDSYKTAIRPDEIIRQLRFRTPGIREGSGYYRLARRKAQDIAKVLVGALVRLDESGRCVSASVSLGALNATPVIAPSVDKLIRGKTKEEALRAAEEYFPPEAGLRESYFKEYKELTTGTAVARALALAYDQAQGRSQ